MDASSREELWKYENMVGTINVSVGCGNIWEFSVVTLSG